MPAQDTSGIKEKILYILRTRGPSLPVHIANQTGLSILFASAFLSELLSEKKIKMSNMRVGSSPVYFIPGQEKNLEKFSEHLKSKEKEAFLLLKEKKFLNDDKQQPAIRVALREIRDFAIPFRKEEQIIWRYFTSLETEFKQKELKPLKIKQVEIINPPSKLTPTHQIKEKSKELDIFDKSIKKKSVLKKKTSRKKAIPQKKNNKFFNKVKEFLSNRSIEILDIESFNKNDLILLIRKQGEEKLLVAYNKKRVNESDIIKANKKASELNLNYIILSLGEPLKKLDSLIDAIKRLSEIEKL